MQDPLCISILSAWLNIIFKYHRRGDPLTYMYPAGLRKLMKWIATRYNGTDVYISETGVMDIDDGVRDKLRVEWIREHANEVLKG